MNFELTREFIEELKSAIDAQDKRKTASMLQDFHPADIVEVYEELNLEEARFVFILLEPMRAADVIVELEEDDRERLLENVPGDILARKFIDRMDSDDAADIIAELPDDVKADVLSNIADREHAGDIADLLNYDEDTAGGLMAKELITVNENWTVATCLREMRGQAQDIDEIYFVYVIDNDGILKGTLSLKKLLLTKSDQVADVYDKDVISVSVDASAEEVANIMNKYDLVALPVIDGIGRLKGRITIDDVVDVIREEAERDYQMASGISSDVEASDNVWQLLRARLPWLMIGMIGGVFGAKVIELYEGQLSLYPEMAFFIPLIAAMGGNVGIQSSAIIVQGLASNSLGIESNFKKLMKELGVAMLNGLSLAAILLLYNFIDSDSLALTVTVSSALLVVIIFASVFGTFVPLGLNKLKIDPALATGPFITTVNDIMGLLLYFLIGHVFYGFWG
ncbi:MAG TPA: magnesium transporter [Salinivirga sp.]|uniref:magnesium transporter n=1 Tax=Salinivirga sp. TaxID=1970192 RepID=UPI002B494940|nr:magnesium transporter [Salinivirga sp.]HKK59703.1 magnesium transporter [Salinivirga sp.]